jgi:hypothetical protein
MVISKVLNDLHFRLNHPLKSADDWCIGIFKNKIKTLDKLKKNKKVRPCDLN